jgi:phage gpG-like protein
MRFGSINAFVRFLDTRRVAVIEGRKRGLGEAASLFQRTAQDMIGAEIAEWPPLADSTVAEKQQLGFTGRISPTDPLYRTGELRTSIKAEVDGNRVVLGSDDPVALFHEFGTANMPPRPFIGATVFREGHDAADLIANYEIGAAMGLAGPLKPVQRRDGDGG